MNLPVTLPRALVTAETRPEGGRQGERREQGGGGGWKGAADGVALIVWARAADPRASGEGWRTARRRSSASKRVRI